MKKQKEFNQAKKKGLKVSLFIHAGILLLALMPFLRNAHSVEENGLEVMEIQFVHADISSASGSSAPAETREVEKNEVKEEVQTEEIEVKPDMSEEIMTDPVEEPVVRENDIDDTPVEEPTEESEVAEVVEEASAESEAGEGDQGEEITGAELGSMDFEGDGIFGRRVIYRADVKKITEREGSVVINLCVNRAGRVTHAAYSEPGSTIHDTEYIRRAMDVASDYLFEKDYSAPTTQCGKLTFIFHIEES